MTHPESDRKNHVEPQTKELDADLKEYSQRLQKELDKGPAKPDPYWEEFAGSSLEYMRELIRASRVESRERRFDLQKKGKN